ncbi:MAG: HupE/UreJ family protein, partial [Pseudomonadota bacterium]
QEETANLIIDYGSGEPKIFRSRGLMLEPVPVSASQLSAIRTFIEQGILHILEGTDHVLFVLCLIIGATTLLGLVERVTGFTIGHTVTLIAGFMGYVPSGAWFVPAVELGIAITIVYAAWMAVKPGSGSSADTLQMFLITTVIGLLHGFGFSFVLHEILRVDSPNLWQSLIAFNVGVEIGQLLIILLVWPLFIMLRRFNEKAWQFAKLGVAAACSVVVTYWIVERTMILMAV